MKAPRFKGSRFAAPGIGTGVLMAAYLLIRPYGDFGGGETHAAAEALASPRWVVAHVAGALAIGSFARLALRLADVTPGLPARVARWAGLTGTVLVLPYYGAETFGLHAVGRAVLAGDASALALVDLIRNHPAALTTFGLGLVLLAVSGISLGLAWWRERGDAAAWPLGIMFALLLPQFYLPPTGRMAYGVAYALAALFLVARSMRSRAQAVQSPAEHIQSATSNRAVAHA